MELKSLPIGIENFEDMITNDYYYIDSMMQYYFENLKVDKAGIFDGLKIMDAGEKYREHQNRYPVIKMSLKGGQLWQ